MPTVAIIGAGASGTLAAIHLLHQARQPLRITLVERTPLPSRGAAYSTTEPMHLLNVRAGNMSAFPDRPQHFVEFSQHVPPADLPLPEPAHFLPRLHYARYLDTSLATALHEAAEGVTADIQRDSATALSIDPATGQQRISLTSGLTQAADRTVLAFGNFEPFSLRRMLRGPVPASVEQALVDNPWTGGGLEGIDPSAGVLLVGTGLTMVDVVVSLIVRHGHRGPIVAISRRGLLPRAHVDPPTPPRAPTVTDVPHTTRGLLRLVRAQIREAAAEGVDWRNVLDGLRPLTQPAWQALPTDQRSQFLRHLQPYWDTHRHRIAPRVGAIVDEALASGQLRVQAGRLIGAAPAETADGVVQATIKQRHGESVQVDVARIINCTGPATDFRTVDEPLVRELLDSGLATPDEANLGFATTADGRLIDRAGQPSAGVFSLGPMRRGELWETTSIPDIRVQAARLAEVLVAELGVGEARH